MSPDEAPLTSSRLPRVTCHRAGRFVLPSVPYAVVLSRVDDPDHLVVGRKDVDDRHAKYSLGRMIPKA